ncbi:hypothetical protein FA95DRAFT_734072 [Auriscalpium vulgare]|uniref:Uncharacterized protein n=1 Tax=Auriscalpium vulgare TaxID=40419 RepID=A0ACB8SC14_9AGAM|nr:hypothetical protein FA95DRAFT_734072 [Auriscalpium vulgare]
MDLDPDLVWASTRAGRTKVWGKCVGDSALSALAYIYPASISIPPTLHNATLAICPRRGHTAPRQTPCPPPHQNKHKPCRRACSAESRTTPGARRSVQPRRLLPRAPAHRRRPGERRLAVVAEEAPSRQSLFSQKGSASTGAAIRREDKFGILSILDSLALEPETPPADDRLLSPYTEDTACDEEALRQAYGARRAAWCEVSSGGAGAGIGSLFVGDEDEDEDGVGASVWGRL